MFFDVNGSGFNYGPVIDAVLRFVTIAAVLFFVIVKPMQAIMSRRASGAPSRWRTPRPRVTRPCC